MGRAPRIRNRKGYRSKPAALDETKRVSSYTFSHADLRHAVSDGELEVLGNCSNGAPAAPGLLGWSLAHGARIQGRR